MGTNEKRRRRNVRDAIIIVILFLLAGTGIYLFAESRTKDHFVTATFETNGKSSRSFQLEVVSTPEARQLGLMFRKAGELKENEGMLFIFPREEMRSFWMKNTFIPLDIIFLDKGWKVVTVLRDVPILNETRRESTAPSQYAIELNAGTAKREGIEAGSVVRLDRKISEVRQ